MKSHHTGRRNGVKATPKTKFKVYESLLQREETLDQRDIYATCLGVQMITIQKRVEQ